MRVVLALASGARRTTSRIRWPPFWRALYALLATRLAVELAAGGLRAVGRVRGPEARDRLLAELSSMFVWSGWPHHGHGWINLDASRFRARVRRRLASPAHRGPRRVPSHVATRLRVGCVGAFAGLLTFSREHVEDRPDEIELVVFDLGFDGRYAGYLDGLVDSYHRFGSSPERVSTLAQAINDERLDLVLVIAPGDLEAVLDRIDTPCIVNVCTGSDLLHNERVDFQLYPQPEADYFAVDGRVFCGTSRSWFSRAPVVPTFFLYDRRGLDPAERLPWDRREPLIVVHGSLFKAASPPFLREVLTLLQEDRELQLVLMGRRSDHDLAAIVDEARRAGVPDRVHYEGGFAFARGSDGSIDEAGWRRLRDLLAQARLAPDPWPLGAGASRLEAYAAGTPSIHLAVRFDRGAWGRPQHSIAEVEALRVERGTAWTPEEYRELCRRCLGDAAYADALAEEQAVVCTRVTDAHAFWTALVDAHGRWLDTGLR